MQHEPVKITITNCQQGREIKIDCLNSSKIFDVAWQKYLHALSEQPTQFLLYLTFSLKGNKKCNEPEQNLRLLTIVGMEEG